MDVLLNGEENSRRPINSTGETKRKFGI